MKHRLAPSIALFLLASFVSSTVFAASGHPLLARAELKNAKGESLGNAILTETTAGVAVKIELSKLQSLAKNPELAIHVHEVGKCEGPEFKSAGGHFNPTGKEHGFNNPKGHHAGDTQKPLIVSKTSEVKTSFVFSEVTLETGKPNSLLKEGGTSLVVHDGLDDQKSQPAGNSGARILCGVIEKK